MNAELRKSNSSYGRWIVYAVDGSSKFFWRKQEALAYFNWVR
jgi:hypothetical protein